MASEKFTEILRELSRIYLESVEGSCQDVDQKLHDVQLRLSNDGCARNLELFNVYVGLISLYATISRPSLKIIQDKESESFYGLRLSSKIDPIAPDGISLVTCSMNRNENLIKAIPSWLCHEEINEILIVDWSSREEVGEALRLAGISDPRVKIVRVENETRWILSYAFNIGFRASRFNKILKVDADIVISSDFFDKNYLSNDRKFIAGNWRSVDPSQAYVNGFFFSPRAALSIVGGFNEYITTYGWDDDDLYSRFEASGFERLDVAPGSILHLPHTDEQRVPAIENRMLVTAREAITSSTRFLIQRNRLIAERMPRWGNNCEMLSVQVNLVKGNLMSLIRSGSAARVPDVIFNSATNDMLLEIASWDFGPTVKEIERLLFGRIIERPAQVLSRIDFEVAKINPDLLAFDNSPYLVIRLSAPKEYSKSQLKNALERITGSADIHGYHCLLMGAFETDVLDDLSRSNVKYGFLPDWLNIEGLPSTSIQDITNGLLEHSAILDLNQSLADHIPGRMMIASPSKPVLFIDAQHGLGNRLRAIGSAAAIAQCTDRELVIIWKPDNHCDCEFRDLFQYDGQILTDSFDISARHCQMYNYMEIEGGEKDAFIETSLNCDIYARSAFVLRHPASNWESENVFLKNLKPVREICNLIDSVRSPNDVALHVRMEAGPGMDHNSYDRPENWSAEDHQLIHDWRTKSHFSHFMARLDDLIVQGQANRVFLAADLPSTYEKFTARYGDRIAWLPRARYDRSAEQLHYALADAILLSRAPRLLGSTWSSFSELAMRFAINGTKVEMSGRDF